MMSAVLNDQNPELEEWEIVRITRYRRPKKQVEMLKSLGVPAKLRCDNTVLVLRMHLMTPTQQQAANDAPKRKSAKK
jgi:hypothetical protein